MGQSTISMAIFNSFLYVYQRVCSITVYGGVLQGYPQTAQTSTCYVDGQDAKDLWRRLMSRFLGDELEKPGLIN